MNICAGIILYNPNIERLTENVNAILPQVNRLVFVDNASANISNLQKIFSDDRFAWILNDVNLGVSGALNQMMIYAKQNEFDWILTLDEDSVCGNDLVQKLLSAITLSSDIAMVSPCIIDRNLDQFAQISECELPDVENIDMCITSGCLTNVNMILDTDGFDERLFIDQVDHDMCLRLKRRGYRILRANNAQLLQEFGQKTVFRRFLWKMVKYHNHSPIRVYYQTRNMIFMVRKYGTEFTPHPLLNYFYRIAAFCVKLIYEPQRLRRTIAFIRGYAAGLTMKL